MNRLMEMLPAYYKDIREFQELTYTQADELDKVHSQIQQIENNQFILTSSESAIARRENMLRIVPDTRTESLDFRRKRVLSRMQTNPPFTLRYLRNLLQGMLGTDGYDLNLDVEKYRLELLLLLENIQFDLRNEQLYKELTSLLDRIVPLNLTLGLTTRRTFQMDLFTGGIISTRNKIQIRPAAFKMPSIQQTKYYAGFISMRSRTIIKSEV